MTLKESYRYQNVLLSVINEALALLSRDNHVTTTIYTNLVSKVVPDMQDEIMIEEPSYQRFSHFDKITEVAEFVEFLIQEKEDVSAAIRRAKERATIDLDSQACLNGLRQKAARVLRSMDEHKTEERILSKAGTGYRFDANGNQVPFKCDQKMVTSINFERSRIRKLMKKFENVSDRVSMELDAAMVNIDVDFVPTFDVNDTFEDMFEWYLSMPA